MATTITPRIVTVNTTVQSSPKANTLQQQGAIVSCGATTLAVNSSAFYPSLAAAQAVLKPALAISTLTSASGVVTATVSGTIGLTAGETFTTTIAGAVPDAFNGTFVATVSATSGEFTLTNALVTGSATSAGTYTPPSLEFVSGALATFFGQGSAVGVSILELGAVTEWSTSVTDLTTYIAGASPQPFYAYLLPPEFDGQATSELATLVGDYSSPTSQTYFFAGCETSNLGTYASSKALFPILVNPLDTSIEAAAPFYDWLSNNPGPANGLAPMAFRFLFGLTPWVLAGNNTVIDAALTAYSNVVLTGAEGGISNACLFKGTTLDGNQASFWYGIDWFRIQVAQRLAAGIINGSNTTNPLLYDQNGINTLLAIAQSVASDAVGYGCVNTATVSAVPFATYVAANPTDYANGIYNGLSATITGQNGFLSITFNLDAVTFS